MIEYERKKRCDKRKKRDDMNVNYFFENCHSLTNTFVKLNRKNVKHSPKKIVHSNYSESPIFSFSKSISKFLFHCNWSLKYWHKFGLFVFRWRLADKTLASAFLAELSISMNFLTLGKTNFHIDFQKLNQFKLNNLYFHVL